MIKIAVLDDYQNVALKMADWSGLSGKGEVTVFNDHLDDAEKVVARLQPFQVICAMRERTPLPRAVIEKLPNLKLIVTTSGRNASIDTKAAAERGIPVCGTTGGPQATAELALGLMLSLMRNIPFESHAMKEGRWQSTVGQVLEGKTLGLLGLGRLGARVAKFAHAFEMKLIAWSQNLTEQMATERGAKLVSKDELFSQSDLISVHLVLSQRSRGLVGARELGLMKPTAYIVNTSRGPIIDEEALYQALSQKKIAGAGIDVYGTEPLSANHPMRKLDNVILTPHLGYVTSETYREFYKGTVEDILAWLDGKPVRVVEPPK